MSTPSTLRFLGAAQTVTGSKFLVTQGTTTVLIDCGLFQGPAELRNRNWEQPPVDPRGLDAVVLTHAHVDHCGYLPRLVAAGFEGPVYATPSTIELARIVLPDCGHLQEEEAEYANRKGYSRHHPALALYTEDEAWEATTYLRPMEFATPKEIAPDVVLELDRAGHILGSASSLLTLGGLARPIRFSGDLGRPSHPFLMPADPPGDVGHLVVESTYGNRRHDEAATRNVLAEQISITVERGGSVLIPAFAVDRTEVILHHLAALIAENRIPSGLPIFVDSPMALDALAVYRAAAMRGDADLRPELVDVNEPFDLPNLRLVRGIEESIALNTPDRPCVIISAAGMLSGGRVVHHLAHMLDDRRNTVMMVGFQAEGTRGRQLLEGASELKMLGRYVKVRASIVDLEAFSVHADAAELLGWVRSADSEPSTVFVVHGEPSAATALARSVRQELDWNAVVPRYGEIVRLDV